MILNLCPVTNSNQEPFEIAETVSIPHFDKTSTKNISKTPRFLRYLQDLSMSAVSPENQSTILELQPWVEMSASRCPNRERILNYHFQTTHARNMFVGRIKYRFFNQLRTQPLLDIHPLDGYSLNIGVSTHSLLGHTILGSSDLVLQSLNIPSPFLATSFSQYDYSQKLKDFEKDFCIDKWLSYFPLAILSEDVEHEYPLSRKALLSLFGLTLNQRLTQLLNYYYGIIAYQTTQELRYMADHQDYTIPEHTVVNALESLYFTSSNLRVVESIANHLLALVKAEEYRVAKQIEQEVIF